MNRAAARLALGTVQFGLPYGIANQSGQVTRSEVKAMLKLVETNGIDTLDTAIAYGNSELCLGEAGVKGFKVVTKLPAVPENCSTVRSWVKGQVAASFSRLGVSSVYGLLLHQPEQLLARSGNEIYQALQELKSSGQVKKIGISIYSPTELEKITRLFRLDLVQSPFNLVDQRMQTSGWLQRLKHEGVEIHTRSAFLQGLLLLSQTARPEKFMPWSNLWERWHNWLLHNNVSALEACLAFPLSFPEVDRVVVGADSTQQLDEIMVAACMASINLPDLQSDSELLINPALWSTL